MTAVVRNLLTAVGLLALASAGGCSFIDRHVAAESKTPLVAATPSAESVTLEIFFARAVLGDATLNGSLWNEIDEQRLPSEARRKLAENGFRAGVVGNHVPVELARLLTLTDKPQPMTDTPPPVNLEAEPNVTMRLLQSRAGKRSEVLCSGNYDVLPLLQRAGESVRGKTFQMADGRFALKTWPGEAKRVQLELVPEVHHGQQQPRWVGTDGILRLEGGKPREVFDDLRMTIPLAPGEMLVMTTLPERSGSLGHYFFTQPTSERTSQKLLVIRVARSATEELFESQIDALAE